MPKSLVIDPKAERRGGTLKSREIPLNRYKSDPDKEKSLYGTDTLNRIYLDMLLIREFETALNEIKTKGEYRGIKYQHRGPAHLSIGQEASSVGQCLPLGVEDLIFGSHRSHGEILAKCLSAIDKLEEKAVGSVLELSLIHI